MLEEFLGTLVDVLEAQLQLIYVAAIPKSCGDVTKEIEKDLSNMRYMIPDIIEELSKKEG